MPTLLGAPRPDRAARMLRAAAAEAGRADRARLLDRLDPAPGRTVLDAGCGPGTDLPALAEPDRGALVVDSGGLGAGRAFTRCTTGHVVRNAAVS